MFDWVHAPVATLQSMVFEAIVQPLLFRLGAMDLAEQAYDAVEWVLIGALEVVVLAVVLGWAERRWPVEPVVDRQAVRVDIVYTLLHRLGAFPLLAFALLVPLFDHLESQWRWLGGSRFELDQVWPGVTDRPLVGFLIYLVVLDAVDYVLHRLQHRWRIWWELHALHHSQRQMTFWSDQRNHLLDDLIRDAVMALVAMLIGVAPGQFIVLVVAARVIQSVQHANLRLEFGTIGERLLVSPSFHRRHHAIGDGHEGPALGCNFGVLFPWWDMLLGTADFRHDPVATGIRDQLDGCDYGRGFWAQQWLALRRIFRAPDTSGPH